MKIIFGPFQSPFWILSVLTLKILQFSCFEFSRATLLLLSSQFAISLVMSHATSISWFFQICGFFWQNSPISSQNSSLSRIHFTHCFQILLGEFFFDFESFKFSSNWNKNSSISSWHFVEFSKFFSDPVSFSSFLESFWVSLMNLIDFMTEFFKNFCRVDFCYCFWTSQFAKFRKISRNLKSKQKFSRIFASQN